MMGEKGYAEWRYCAPPSWWDEEKFAPTRNKYFEMLKANREARDRKRMENASIREICLRLSEIKFGQM
jgi:hypothetical protein